MDMRCVCRWTQRDGRKCQAERHKCVCRFGMICKTEEHLCKCKSDHQIIPCRANVHDCKCFKHIDGCLAQQHSCSCHCTCNCYCHCYFKESQTCIYRCLATENHECNCDIWRVSRPCLTNEHKCICIDRIQRFGIFRYC